MATKIVLAQTTVDSEEAARRLATGAVKGRLAACVHLDAPLTAVYRWEGSIETGIEWRVAFKTTEGRLPALTEWVMQEHPYEVPAWIVLPIVAVSDAYLAWVVQETAAE
ncbi:divalent-cation tolerance protein CutA [Streptomyces sp. NPDC093093]|uniref:divalent-cation tolerance protein CutA n=1 Tax=Streptomyces sp. NPDC093093 TaxID=3366025 RepID=UPI0038263C63